MNSWNFAPLEYVLGWKAFGRDVLNYPLQYRSTAETEDDYLRECREAAANFSAEWGDNLYSSFVTLAMPDARVQVCGFDGPNRDRKIRVHTAVRQNVGVVLVQEPGPDHDHGGRVHMSRVAAATVAQLIVDAVPPMRAGRHNAMRAELDDLVPRGDDDYHRRASMLQTSGQQRPAGQDMKRLMNRPRVGIGHVAVYSGPAVDDPPADGGGEFHWTDFEDDGRYLARTNRTMLEVGPVDSAGMVDTLRRLITRAATAYVRQGD